MTSAGATSVAKTVQIPTISKADFTCKLKHLEPFKQRRTSVILHDVLVTKDFVIGEVPWILIWGEAEAAMTIMAASIPWMRTLLFPSKRQTPENSSEQIKTIGSGRNPVHQSQDVSTYDTRMSSDGAYV
jgi:hypothetical protein